MTDNLKTKKILSYDDVVRYPAGDSLEPLVDVRTYDDTITAIYKKMDMIPITGESIYLRDTVVKKITVVEAALRSKGYRLKIVYGYRHPDIQKQYFEARKEILIKEHPELAPSDFDSFTHNFVAVPDIAGHPAGAAVDITIIDIDGNDIDMGTGIADYTDKEKIKTYADNISASQINNRKLLHDLMVAEGFAPFYGEWWHFSYGDREWAAFYNKKALYSAVDFRV